MKEGCNIEGLSPGFTVQKKLKENVYPHTLDDMNQKARTHISSTLIQHFIQYAKQGSEQILSTSGLNLIACATLHFEEPADHWSNDITLSLNTPESSKLSPALEKVT